MRAIIVMFFCLTACTTGLSQNRPTTSVPGCQFDAQCKGSRVCSNHYCANPMPGQVEPAEPRSSRMQPVQPERGTPAERCDLGDINACYDYAMSRAIGMGGVSKDEGDARAYFQKACRGGHVFGCVNLLFLLKKKGDGKENHDFNATGMDRDYSDFVTECATGNPSSCYHVARILDRSITKGIKKDIQAARAYYSKACDNDHASSCREVANMWQTGAGGPKDKNAADALFKKACKLGAVDACK